MNNFNITSILTSNVDLNMDLIGNHVKHLPKINLEKDDFLIRGGEHCKHSFYVEKGLLRYYSIDKKGKEHILYFAPEGWLVMDRESICLDMPTEIYIQALDRCIIVPIEDEIISRLEKDNPLFREFNTRYLINHIKLLQTRIQQLLSDSAEERYLKFVEIYPDLLLRIPQWMTASYLGITPESLSRVRKEFATKNCKK